MGLSVDVVNRDWNRDIFSSSAAAASDVLQEVEYKTSSVAHIPIFSSSISAAGGVLHQKIPQHKKVRSYFLKIVLSLPTDNIT